MTAKQKKIVKRWVKALESGEYEQNKGALRKGNRFCCLGVLCDLAVKAKVINPPTILISDYGDDFAYGNGGYTGALPDSVRRWAGLSESSGAHRSTSLAALNDSGRTFKTIAKVIESEPEGLFQ
jgi:hypothetical protein